MYMVSTSVFNCPKSQTNGSILWGRGCTLYTKRLIGTRPEGMIPVTSFLKHMISHKRCVKDEKLKFIISMASMHLVYHCNILYCTQSLSFITSNTCSQPTTVFLFILYCINMVQELNNDTFFFLFFVECKRK